MHRELCGVAGDSEDSEKSQPNRLSSTEYLPVVDSRSFRAPEVNLMAAVLDDAIICFILNDALIDIKKARANSFYRR